MNVQPFKKGDIVRYYTCKLTGRHDDAVVTYAHPNGGLDVTHIVTKINYGWSAKMVVLAPKNEDK